MRERRLEKRFWCSDLVRVDWSDGQSRAGKAEALLEDISAHGACVQVEETIPVGVAIAISAGRGGSECAPGCLCREVRFSGCVSYCARGECGYFVGIRFAEGTKWSSQVYQPGHLTNPAALEKG